MKTNILFRLPRTRLCRVVYTAQGVNYGAVVPTPAYAHSLQPIMLARHVAMRQVVRVEPVREFAARS